jgi:2-keto-4-pentenoate hydratase
MSDAHALALELAGAFATRHIISTPPSARGDQFDLDAGYNVERELARMRVAAGRRLVGVKVGFANKALWRVLKLDTLVWAHMYDDTVRDAAGNAATLSVDSTISPKIEPEIVFKMKAALGPGITDAAAVLDAVEWLALGFEIIDCPYADWKYQPSDFVAALGLHAALIVGQPLQVIEDNRADLAERLAKFKVRLSRGEQLVEEGSGRNSLRSPALCLAELASAMAARGEPLETASLVSSGTLTESMPIVAGETWTATVEGLDLPPLSVRVT